MQHISLPLIDIHIRCAEKNDLDAINQVVESAILSWQLPERVKRLSLPSYHYDSIDFDHLTFNVAEDHQDHIIGVISWEASDTKNLPVNANGLLIHGLYVDPVQQNKKIGQQLFSLAEQTAKAEHYDGLLVKAQKDAEYFFTKMGMFRLAVDDTNRQYANRFWKTV